MMPFACGGRAVLDRHLPDGPEQIVETINRQAVGDRVQPHSHLTERLLAQSPASLPRRPHPPVSVLGKEVSSILHASGETAEATFERRGSQYRRVVPRGLADELLQRLHAVVR